MTTQLQAADDTFAVTELVRMEGEAIAPNRPWAPAK